MLIVQISDTHITAKGTKAYGVAPMAENLSLCVEHINQLNPKPDLVLVTGDLTCSGKISELEHARSLLDQIYAPYFVIPGNHDDRLNLMSVFEKSTCPVISSTENQHFINYVIDDFEIRLITVDSNKTGKPGGEICQTRATWLDKQLSKNTDKPTIVFMHHPPLNLSIVESNVDGFIGADRLGKIIEKYTNIERILCGHIHLPTFACWHGTIVSTAPSIGMKLLLDLTMQQPSQFLLEAPSYQLHHWTPEKNLVSHTVTVSSNEQTYLFEKY